MSKFFVVGDVTVDLMYFVDDLPEAGGEVSVSLSVMEPGGAGGTIATMLARLGHEVKIATRLGHGPFADMALKNVLESGVDDCCLQRDTERQTGSVTLLVTPDAQRTMISSSGASRYLDPEKISTDEIASCDALVMSAYSLLGGQQREYAMKALHTAYEAGLTTFIDMGSGVVNMLKNRLISFVQEVDYLLMNQKELFTLTGEDSISDAVEGLAEHGVERVIVKVGEAGSIVITPELTELVDSYPVDDVVNTAGAGDYYTAAFAHGIMTGQSILEAAKLGNIAGALNVTELGAQQPNISLADLERLAKESKLVES